MARRKRVWRKWIGLSVFLFLVLGILILQTPVLHSARGAVWSLWRTTIAHFFRIGAIRVTEDVMNQLQTLRSENIRLQAEVQDLARIRGQLGKPAFADYRAVSAAIIGRPADTFRARYVLNRGTRDGVTLQAPVVIHGSTLIGFISELHTDTAVVQLLTHPTTNVTAEIVQSEKEAVGRGLVQGSHFTAVTLTTVPRDVALSIGLSVVTSAREQLIPAGLLIGSIKAIRSSESDAYQSASLALTYDIDQVDAVHILILQP